MLFITFDSERTMRNGRLPSSMIKEGAAILSARFWDDASLFSSRTVCFSLLFFFSFIILITSATTYGFSIAESQFNFSAFHFSLYLSHYRLMIDDFYLRLHSALLSPGQPLHFHRFILMGDARRWYELISAKRWRDGPDVCSHIWASPPQGFASQTLQERVGFPFIEECNAAIPPLKFLHGAARSRCAGVILNFSSSFPAIQRFSRWSITTLSPWALYTCA